MATTTEVCFITMPRLGQILAKDGFEKQVAMQTSDLLVPTSLSSLQIPL